ncbi:helix-turn-helix transcriptional regulator [Megasphaera stantonii]|uniref:helix-turn-helix transcriptional regulator n=1 Tax=Megasphaera stantonii TaxID=2144175 RepID=UPI001DA0E3E1|nr:helix-turn-helix domain-containing protein [Megasphaera stantonii]HJE82948.1 helix-turn-helix domain-containing protein [Megasphaera stantonii]
MKNKVKEYREKNNMTATELAYKTGVSERYILFIEAGKRTPSLRLANRIAMVLKEGVDKIFCF